MEYDKFKPGDLVTNFNCTYKVLYREDVNTIEAYRVCRDGIKCQITASNLQLKTSVCDKFKPGDLVKNYDYTCKVLYRDDVHGIEAYQICYKDIKFRAAASKLQLKTSACAPKFKLGDKVKTNQEHDEYFNRNFPNNSRCTPFAGEVMEVNTHDDGSYWCRISNGCEQRTMSEGWLELDTYIPDIKDKKIADLESKIHTLNEARCSDLYNRRNMNGDIKRLEIENDKLKDELKKCNDTKSSNMFKGIVAIGIIVYLYFYLNNFR